MYRDRIQRNDRGERDSLPCIHVVNQNTKYGRKSWTEKHPDKMYNENILAFRRRFRIFSYRIVNGKFCWPHFGRTKLIMLENHETSVTSRYLAASPVSV